MHFFAFSHDFRPPKPGSVPNVGSGHRVFLAWSWYWTYFQTSTTFAAVEPVSGDSLYFDLPEGHSQPNAFGLHPTYTYNATSWLQYVVYGSSATYQDYMLTWCDLWLSHWLFTILGVTCLTPTEKALGALLEFEVSSCYSNMVKVLSLVRILV